MADALKFLMFKNMLADLSLDSSARITSGTRYDKKDVTDLGNTTFQFISYFIAFDNKESYLWYRYMDMQQKYPSADYKSLIREFAEQCLIHEKTRIGEIGWEVKYRITPGHFPAVDRGKIMIDQARRMRQYIKDGYGGVTPSEGDVLTSYPYGANVRMQLGLDAWLAGKEERAKFGKLFGLGDKKKNGWNYGRYDSNLKLRPI